MASACSVAVATDAKLIGTDFLRTPAASTCVLVTISLVCTCFLVVCGVLVVREYSLAMAYDETRCRLKNVTYTREISCLFCPGLKDKSKEKGAGACVASQFPCVRLTVTYVGADGREAGNEAMLHPDSLQATGPYNQCSFNICLRTKEDSRNAVHNYTDEWRSVKSDFSCYYHTAQRDTVIAQKMYTQADVIHAMLWPSLVVLACAVIFLRLEMRRRDLTCCGSRLAVTGRSGRGGGEAGEACLNGRDDGGMSTGSNSATKMMLIAKEGTQYGRLEGEGIQGRGFGHHQHQQLLHQQHQQHQQHQLHHQLSQLPHQSTQPHPQLQQLQQIQHQYMQRQPQRKPDHTTKQRGKDDTQAPQQRNIKSLALKSRDQGSKGLKAGLFTDSFDCHNIASRAAIVGNVAGIGRSVVYASLPAMDNIGSLSSMTVVMGTVNEKFPVSQGSLVDHEGGCAGRASSFEEARREGVGGGCVGRACAASVDGLTSNGS